MKLLIVLTIDSPEIELPTRIVHGGLNGTVSLECRIYSDPIGVVEWRKNNVVLSNVRGRYSLKNPQKWRYILVINRLIVEDFANYFCSASNTYGDDTKKIQLQGK